MRLISFDIDRTPSLGDILMAFREQTGSQSDALVLGFSYDGATCRCVVRPF